MWSAARSVRLAGDGLLSRDESSFMTAATMIVDGGITAAVTTAL